MQKLISSILSLLFCLLAYQAQEARSLVRRALTAPLKLAKPLARPVNWVTQTQFYKKHPWLVKAGAVIATGLVVKKYYHTYKTRKRLAQDQLDISFCLAVKSSDLNKIDNLLKRGANIHSLFVRSESLLYQAIENDNLAVVKKLIAAKIDINSRNFFKKTPLIYACEQNCTKIALELISTGVQINETDIVGNTALIHACKNNNVPLVDALLAAGAKVNAKNSSGETALVYACENNSNEIASALIKAGADACVSSRQSKSLLHIAVEKNSVDLVRMLLHAHASVDALNDRRETALYMACLKNYTEIARALIHAHADVNIMSNIGFIPLWQAVYCNNTILVDELLTAGADVHIVSAHIGDGGKSTAFTLAMKKRNYAIMQKLITASTRIFDENYYKIFDEARIQRALQDVRDQEIEAERRRYNSIALDREAQQIKDDMKAWIDEQHQLAREKMDAHLQATTLPDPLRKLVTEYAIGASAIPAVPTEQAQPAEESKEN